MSKRISQLESAIELVRAELADWQGDDNQLGIMPSSRLWKAMTVLIGTFKNGDMPQRWRDIDYQVRAISGHWDRFAEGQAVALNRDSRPETAFFLQLEQLLSAATSMAPVKHGDLPGIDHYLNREKLTELQIAKVYDWKNENGDPDRARVSAEIAKGSKSEFWTTAPDPRNARLEQARQQEVATIESLTESLERKQRRKEPVAPESLEELVNQGVTGEQIAKILGWTTDEVLEACERESLPAPLLNDTTTGRFPEPASSNGQAPGSEGSWPEPVADGSPETDSAADDELTGNQPGTVDEFVRAYLEQHPEASNKEIADVLGEDFEEDVPWQTINAARRRIEAATPAA